MGMTGFRDYAFQIARMFVASCNGTAGHYAVLKFEE